MEMSASVLVAVQLCSGIRRYGHDCDRACSQAMVAKMRQAEGMLFLSPCIQLASSLQSAWLMDSSLGLLSEFAVKYETPDHHGTPAGARIRTDVRAAARTRWTADHSGGRRFSLPYDNRVRPWRVHWRG